MKTKDLIEGEVYKYIISGDEKGFYIFRYGGYKGDRYICLSEIKPATKKFFGNDKWGFNAGNLEKVNNKELEHFIACERANKYVECSQEINYIQEFNLF